MEITNLIDKIIHEVVHLADTLLHGYDRTVGFPLYRLQVFFYIVPAILQLAYWEVPVSIGSVTPQWYHGIFLGMQLVGAILILASLAMGDTPDSAKMERPGALLLGTTSVVYFIGLWTYYDGKPPLVTATWVYFAFGLFCFIRMRQITKKLKRTDAKVLKERAEGRIVE